MKSKLFLFFFILTAVTFSKTTFFIKYRKNVTANEIESIIATKNLGLKQTNSVLSKNSSNISIKYFAKGLGKESDALVNIIKVETDSDLSQSELENIFSSVADVEYVQKSNTYKIDIIPDDEHLSEQWGLVNTNSFSAWDITKGSDTVVVGVIDTGIDYLHEDISSNIFINKNEDLNVNNKLDAADLNGIDDDNNGFVDDVIGWDFTDRQGFPFDSTGGDYLNWDNNPLDDNGHGTNVAGIIAAESNNKIGISGIAPNVKLLNLRAFDPTGNGEEDDVAAAILYAVKQKVKVINMSFGDASFSLVLKDVINYAYNKGVILIASAGNDGKNILHYPSGYSEVLSVGASTKEDYIANFSNYGSTIDLIAPGSEIFTTAIGNGYTSIAGTSAAAPFVSGVAALIKSVKNFSPDEVYQVLKSTSDDIQPVGWDDRSGAGRLNAFNALSALAPAIVKFDSPKQDYCTNKDSMIIIVTALSPYFVNYDLDYGIGNNPTTWTTLIDKQTNQVNNKNIFNLSVKNFKDSVYTLRLLVRQVNGRNLEERINFIIDRTPPQIELVSLSSAYYGEKSTVLAQVYTSDISTLKMFYRQKGTANFSFTSLDGFNTNTFFVKQLHYGFIPKSILNSNTTYEIYFEAENLAGLKSILKNKDNYYEVTSDKSFNLIPEYKQDFTLPYGNIFKNPVNFTNQNYSELLLQEAVNSNYSTYLYKLEGNQLIKVDSTKTKFPKEFGDFNNNGKWDLLSSFSRSGIIDEQSNSSSTSLNQQYIDTTGNFFPILARDIDNDGKIEVLSLMKDSVLAVWQVNNNLSVTLEDTLRNFSQKDKSDSETNIFPFANAEIADANNDDKYEIWAVDHDGDIMSFGVDGINSYSGSEVIHTDFASTASIISKGNYDGDNIEDIAVLLQSSENYSIAPYNFLLVFNTNGNKLNVVFEKYFIDPSAEYNSSFRKVESALRLTDINNDQVDEIILFAFPYSYIFSYDGGKNTVINYKENINSNCVFIGDINSNGIPEVAFPNPGGIDFYEFIKTDRPNTPNNLTGFSVDSTSVQLSWEGNSNKYYILRGVNNSLSIVDSTDGNIYLDKNVSKGAKYFYQVIATDETKIIKNSSPSNIAEIFVHNPAKVIGAKSLSSKNILLTFDEKVKNTIENIQSFKVNNSVIPSSVSSESEYSYLLSMKESLSVGENRIIINGLRDFYNSPIATVTVSFDVQQTEQQEQFYISSFRLESSNEVRINFNLAVNQNSCLQFSNYEFNPSNSVTSVSFADGENNSITLKTEKPVSSIGKEFRLKLKNIFSSESTGSIKINEETGSYIILSSYADHLENVFVYPSPVRLKDNNFLTFANLTKRAKIIIFNLNGNKIKELYEDNGDGGVEWDLKTDDGSVISSGVYIYRVTSIDDKNNEGNNKIGKFVVIK
ncbi:MAG: T9SS C-terminal target domain-containing protein [Ignavibacteriales bacterium]|nr:MAG: T9SS C-terminal target domain-containing protein [Ignavibacteriales bacterium]